jgi:hypothetical protein
LILSRGEVDHRVTRMVGDLMCVPTDADFARQLVDSGLVDGFPLPVGADGEGSVAGTLNDIDRFPQGAGPVEAAVGARR